MAKRKPTKRARVPAQSAGLATSLTDTKPVTHRLLADVRGLIEQARQQTARAVNTALVGLYWHIGKRIRQDILRESRAEYGEEIVQTLSAQLTAEFGRGFGRRNLFQMIRFAEALPDEGIVCTMGWSHWWWGQRR